MSKPVDYSKWNTFAQEGYDDAATSSDAKAWSQMDTGERGRVAERAALEEKRMEVNRKQHEAYLKCIDDNVEDEDTSWMHDVDANSYEDFTIKRAWRVVKPKGADFFKRGELHQAEQQWLGCLELVQKVGISWPTAATLYVQLKCNLAQLYIKQNRWAEARQLATAALAVDPDNEKALYRRAVARRHFSEWVEARRDLETLLRASPNNAEAWRLLAEVRETLQQGKVSLQGAGLKCSNAVQDLTQDGTLRKISICVPGQRCPDDIRWMWPWGHDEWLGSSIEKAVLRLHVVVKSVGGEELFTTRGQMHLPETPQEQNYMRNVMKEVAYLDDVAGKKPRTPGDFYEKETSRHPMCWRYGDPTVYSGFELASRSMMLGEKAMFEIDQPLLEPSVSAFYGSDGGVARTAGLPDLKHHVEERKLHLLAEELPEWELDLASKTQRTVRVEMELLSIQLYRDISPARTGEYLLHVVSAGRKEARQLRPGLTAVGDFCIASALSGKSIYHVERAVWILGNEGGQSEKHSDCDGTVWIPKCVGKAIQDAGPNLCEGAYIEVRLQAGPAPWQLNPEKARTYDWKRATDHRPPVAMSIFIHELRSSAFRS